MVKLKNLLWHQWLFRVIAVIVAILVTYKIMVQVMDHYANHLISSRINQKGFIEFALATEIFDKKETKIGEISSQARYLIPLNKIPQHVIDAFLAAEDSEFYAHDGFDPWAVIRALWHNLRAGRIVEGASTISQQCARLHFLTQEKTIKRKIQEIVLARYLERSLGKKRILELYLNTIFMGRGAYGIEAAARVYFNKPVTDLSIAEAALLAGLPKAPSFYAPHKHFQRAQKRQVYVLTRMREEGFLSKQQYQEALKEKLIIAEHPRSFQWRAPYFTAQLTRELEKILGKTSVKTQGLSVVTTLDLDLEKKMRHSLRQALFHIFLKTISDKRQRRDVQMAAIGIKANTGEILFLQGARNFKDSQYNRVYYAQRPVGALYLPVLYGYALDHGFTLLSSLYSEGVNFYHQPKNENELTLYEGLLAARNIDSARLGVWLGLGSIDQFNKTIGIHFGEPDLSHLLGAGRESLIRLVASFTMFMNEGQYIEPFMIKKILSSDRRVIFDKMASQPRRVLSSQAAYSIRLALSDVLRFGVGKISSLWPKSIEGGMPAASESLHDGWFIGFNQDLIIGVWVGAEHGHVKLASSKQELMEKMSELWFNATREIWNQSVTRVKRPLPPGIVFVRSPLTTAFNKNVSIPVNVDQL